MLMDFYIYYDDVILWFLILLFLLGYFVLCFYYFLRKLFLLGKGIIVFIFLISLGKDFRIKFIFFKSDVKVVFC